ncbi:uncharacterized protein si:ch211-199g17.2 isoform X2 [Corythoichthys intestinalis]|uniref:uncharacterized protein si:ch211-199g17.2 isoform X2 n=1 Tax=Corythoichthys intestinalis TaxID=161448 RepID=UPI0025A54645|nr:uncharacterized protein si:ch211-199g17.2 isoform X2 [Corythoichthys intestinalis]
MQHGTQRGLSSELFESLKVYLNNKNRLQPIIGLRCITECVTAGSPVGGEAVYLCEVCVCRLNKSDMRNHIMGSLHRYNYIKARHPHLLSGVNQSGVDMSLLAWPLMDIARTLEKKEGPGNIKLFEAEESAFERLKCTSDSEGLVKSMMHGPDGPESPLNDENENEEGKHRVVTICHKVVAGTDGNGWNSMESSPSFGHTLRDRYRGSRPLIGLFRVTECVCDDDDRTYCFLCHCCRTRVITRLFIQHVSSATHMRSYLMETRREQVQASEPNVSNRALLMDSLAGEVEREEGRGDMEVVKASQLLCIQLAKRNYNWCIATLWNTSYPKVHKKKKAKKGASWSTIYPLVVLQCSKLKKQQQQQQQQRQQQQQQQQQMQQQQQQQQEEENRSKTQVVFKVSLPLTEGPLLLKRTYFSQDSPPDQDFECEPTDREDNDSSVTPHLELSQDQQSKDVFPDNTWQNEAPVAREWYNSAYAQWRDWSPAPFEKQQIPYQANPQPINPAEHHVPSVNFQSAVNFQSEFQSVPAIWPPHLSQASQPHPGGIPEYSGYTVPPWPHPTPYFIPPVYHSSVSVPPRPL